MDDHNQTISLRLYEILDWIGASEKMRNKFREQSITTEIVINMVSNVRETPTKMYILGSIGEGTTTTGLEPDIDIVRCHTKNVVETLSDASPHGISFLIVTDDTTKPGYCKLQSVLSKASIHNPEMTAEYDCIPDQYGRMCLQHMHNIDFDYQEINGPALTRTGFEGKIDQDLVIALACHDIPSFASSWITRVASCNRLNRTQLNMLTEFGCFFVGTNHPSSQNGPIEWRLSFSLQERELMSCINPTQYKCYILLKMIKKDILHQLVPASISSYHCKTCVLYAIEIYPLAFWTRKNLLECLLLCIKLLLHWVKEKYCPNYFIPEENMFDRIEQRTLQQVESVLEDMVTHWCRFIWKITCDDISNLLSRVLSGCGPSTMRIQHIDVSFQTLILYVNITSDMRSRTMLILHSTHAFITDRVRDHTEQETRQAIRYFLPHLCLQIAQSLASEILSTIDTYLFGLFKHLIEASQNCDTISSYLIIASHYLQSDRDDMCEKILLKCEMSLKSHVVSVCGCDNKRPRYQDKSTGELESMLCSQDIPYLEFARTCISGCLVFLPHQANIVPSALHYEMYRPVYTPPGSRDEEKDFWFDWMVVDSKVYLYFMQYVLYTKTNKPVYKQDAVDKLRNVMDTDLNLGHRETAWNLLGWIFKQENKIQEAMKCFVASWRIRPNHNAAKWHMLSIIRTQL